MKHSQMWVGLAFWCGLIAVLCGKVAGEGRTAPATGRRALSDLWGYYTSSRRLELRLPISCDLSAGDPVFATDSNGSLRQVGVIVSFSDEAKSPQAQGETITAQAVLFSSAPPSVPPPSAGGRHRGGVKAYYLSPPNSIEWIVRTLLPPERRKQIENELAAAIQEHHREILNALQPVVRKSVREALAVLEQDLPRAIDKHRPELEAIAGKDKEEIVKKELVPLVKAEVGPIVRKDSAPLVRQVSGELWERVSLWSFAWRGVVDKLPLVRNRNRLEMELQRFLDQEAVPIFERHEGDFLSVIEIILRDIADNEKVRAACKRSFAKVAEDPELQRVLNDILHEAVVENPRFWGAVRQNLSSPEAQEALRLAGNRLEPTVRRIGDLVLGTREGGLTPEFNRVLRQQILLKDRHGIIVGDLPPSGSAWPCTPLEAWFSGETKP